MARNKKRKNSIFTPNDVSNLSNSNSQSSTIKLTEEQNEKAFKALSNLKVAGSTQKIDVERSTKADQISLDLETSNQKKTVKFSWNKTKSLNSEIAQQESEQQTPVVDSNSTQITKPEIQTKKDIDINFKVDENNAVISKKEDKKFVRTTSNRAIKAKLANMTTANPKDLCIRTKLTKDTVDLARYFDHNLLIDFFRNSDDVLSFSRNLGTSDLEYYLASSKTPDEFLTHCGREGITLPEAKIQDLKNNFEKSKTKIMNEIVDKSTDQKRKFETLIKANAAIVENTGMHSLYIAYDFLVGTTRTGVAINAPIVLYPVDLVHEQNSYSIQHNKNNFVVNEKLLTLLKKEYELQWIIADIAKIDDLNDLLNLLRSSLKSPFKVISNPNHDFKDYTSVELSKIPYLSVYDSAVLGIFEPSGGALKDNLEQLVDMNIDPFVSEHDYSDSKFIEEEVDAIPLLEIGRPLNIYQKYAVRSALSQNTLIYGPPGTGKSEVISNIIANAISLNRTVLVVSEKKAALDVLHERLQSLNKLAIFIYDLEDKQNFYNKIAAIGDRVNNMRLEGVEYKPFNLRQKLEGTKRWVNVDDSHKKIRGYIWTLLELNKKVDSLGTTFTDYVEYKSKIDTKILKYAKEANVIEYIENIMDKYFIESIDKLMFKFNEYKDFLLNYGIDEQGISDKLKWEKVELTKLQVNDNLLEYLIESQQKIQINVNMLIRMFETYGLIEDSEFLNLLKVEPNLIKRQKDALIHFAHKYDPLIRTGFLNFLVNHYDQLDHFIAKYDSAKEQDKIVILNKFVSSGKVSKFKPIIANKYKLDDGNSELKIKAIKDFVKIPHARYQYIPQLLDNKMDFIDKNTVHFYLNKWLLNTYVKDLGLKQFTFFDDEVLVKLAPMKQINSELFNAYKRIINFEKDVLDDYVELLRINVNDLVNKDRDIIIDAASNASRDIESFYLEYLRNTLSQLSPEQKARMQDIFAIARRTSKSTASIKDFVQEYYKELSLIFPIWISLPELVAQIFPLEKGIFDYGIFDEASQMFVERAYPLVYRCKTSIVAGDDKQLKPTSFFSSRIMENKGDYDLNDNDQVDSLLDRAQVSLWSSYNLRNHYRSTHRDLIQFSNDYIYNKNLHFATKNGTNNPGIEVINTNGYAEDSINEAEAQAVIEQLKLNIDRYKKIIVITFGAKQSTYIEQLLFKQGESLGEVYKKYINGQVVITNLENVQGNEGDLVILSITYAKNKEGILRNSYGPLIMDGGANRLNVAITRAKDKMIIIKSISASEMNINLSNPNAVVFKSFIEYCDRFNSLAKRNVKIKKEPYFKNQVFRDSVLESLSKMIAKKPNLEIVKNYDIGSKVIDYAIVNRLNQKVELAVLLNDWTSNFTIRDYLESVDNFYFVSDRGYKVIRIEEFAWMCNPSILEANMSSIIDSLMLR